MESIRVLLVDDEVDFARSVARRLAHRGLLVEVAPGGSEGLARLEAFGAEVVVLDLKMPGMDGIETLQEIKSRHPAVEVIMLSGHACVEAAIRGMELGAFDYLMKPVALEELMAKVEDAAMCQRHGGLGTGAGKARSS